MEVDAVHAMIENKITNETIFLPSDYLRLSVNARKKQPLEPKEVTYDFVQDFSRTDLLMYSSIRPGKKPRDPCVTDLKEIKYSPNGNIEYKLKFDTPFTLLPLRRRRLEAARLFEFQQYRCSPIKLKLSKWKHLQELKAVIPQSCHSFYDSLPHE